MLPVNLAYAMAVVLIVASIGPGLEFLDRNLAVVMAVYIAIQLGYCFGLKNLAVIDICIVSSGFPAARHRRRCRGVDLLSRSGSC